jgi:hypothetical protein
MGKMKELAIELANTDRELEKALGMSIEELESSVNGNITTDFATIHTAIVDAVSLGMDLSKEHSSKGIPRMHIEIEKIMKRFPTLGEKLDNV